MIGDVERWRVNGGLKLEVAIDFIPSSNLIDRVTSQLSKFTEYNMVTVQGDRDGDKMASFHV